MSLSSSTTRMHDGLLPSAGVRDYIDLLKPRVMSLVIFTSLCSMMVAPASQHIVMRFIALLCIAVGAGGSGCLNMWLERDIDAVMSRTRKRPLPEGKIHPDTALAFGLVLSLGSVFLMAVCVNYLSAGLLLFTIFFYTIVYTIYLKPRTPYNIVLGGLAGALPPLIAWTSVTNSMAIAPLVMVLVIFLWTVPHFWALALVKSHEYAKAGIPMFPSVYGAERTKKQILMYSIVTSFSPLILCFIGFNSLVFGVMAIVLGAGLIHLSLMLLTQEKGGEMRLFAYSIFYLFVLFLGMVFDRILVMI